MRPVVLTVLASFLALAACSDGPSSPAGTSPTAGASNPALTATGSPTTVDVADDGSVAVSLPGVGSLTGGPGSVTGGRLQVAPVSARSTSRIVSSTGPGVDVTTLGEARIVQPLSLSLVAVSPRRGLRPVVMHQRHDGTWEYRVPSWDGRTATLRTKDFSVNVLGWLNLDGFFDSAGDFLKKQLAGRTDPITCAGGAHPWGALSTDTDMVHTCLISNDDRPRSRERVELQLKSNRGAFVQVDVPAADVDYVWVEGQPDAIRSMIAGMVGLDPARHVMLAPGQTMTIGYTRPTSSRQALVTVSASTRAALLSGFIALIEALNVDTRLDPQSALRIAQGCVPKDALVNASAEKLWDLTRCVLTEGTANLVDPTNAFRAAQDLLGPAATKGELDAQTQRLVRWGRGAQNVGFLAKLYSTYTSVRGAMLSAWSPAFDSFATLVTNGGGTAVMLDLTAPRSTTPVSPQPPASRLSVTLSEDPFLCDGRARALGTLSGARPGEQVLFSSPQVDGLRPGAADAGGRLALRWQCTAAEAATVWAVTARTSSGSSVTFTVHGRAPAVQAPAPAPVPQPAPQVRGFTIEDTFLNGTWARRDPNDGRWFSASNRPANAAYWFANGLGVGVDCVRSAAAYSVSFVGGGKQTWTWWAHVTDNTWVPMATFREISADGSSGMPSC